MSTLGHVLILLPFLRDFTHGPCIASFLTRSPFSPAGFTAPGDVKEGNFSCVDILFVGILFVDTRSAVIRFAVIRFAATLFVGILCADTLSEGAARIAPPSSLATTIR
jgi:hypothetical protein